MIGVLIKTHFLDCHILEKAARIADEFAGTNIVDVILSVDVTLSSPDVIENLPKVIPGVKLHFFDSKIQRKLGFPKHSYVSARNLSVNWFHSDYSLIDFYMQNRGSYDIFWQIEYDVYLQSGSWKFLEFDYGVDFMASSFKIKESQYRSFVQNDCILQPQWFWWEKLVGHLSCVGCFFPCVRLSAEAVESLISSYRKGVCGFSEVSAPSILALKKHTIKALSIINDQDATIFHPHWQKLHKKDSSKDFQLNAINLFVD